MHADGLLRSAKPRHIEQSDQSAIKKLYVVVKASGAHTEFCLD